MNFWVGFALGFAACLTWLIAAISIGCRLGTRLRERHHP